MLLLPDARLPFDMDVLGPVAGGAMLCHGPWYEARSG